VALRILSIGLVLVLAMIGAGSVLGVIAAAMDIGSAWFGKLRPPLVQLAVATTLFILTACTIFGFRDLVRILVSHY
jgi:hypothetical protein